MRIIFFYGRPVNAGAREERGKKEEKEWKEKIRLRMK
jgi:hypothetical protein